MLVESLGRPAGNMIKGQLALVDGLIEREGELYYLINIY